jgi:hypothetical protein
MDPLMFGANPLVVVGPGVSELLLTHHGGIYYLRCRGCGASVSAPIDGVASMRMLHERDCRWLDSLRARMPTRQ